MESLLSKLSSYDLVNYIFLGGLVFILGVLLKISFLIDVMTLLNSLKDIMQIASYLIFVYFLGILISRVGSILESILKRLNIIQYASYSDYILAEKKDTQISILLVQANLYRSLLAMFIVLLFTKLIQSFNFSFTINKSWAILFICLILFYFSWKKQVNYIRKRIEEAKT